MRQRKALVVFTLIACMGFVGILGDPLRLSGGCDEIPIVNLPFKLRQRNWLGQQGTGSCVHASMIMLLRWQGQYKLADWWRANHGDGEYPERFAKKLDAAGVRFAETTSGDVSFLEWACRTRRGCAVVTGVYMYGDHMVCLVHLDNEWAGILDNNNIGVITWKRRADFLMDWKVSGGWAVTPVYSPVPPLPQ